MENIDNLRKNYEKVLNGVNNQDAPGRSNRPILLITLKKANNLNGEDQCKSSKPGSKGTQAFVIQAKDLEYFRDLKKNAERIGVSRKSAPQSTRQRA